MKILVYGSGAREHALCWKMAKSSLNPQLFSWPGHDFMPATPLALAVTATSLELITALKQQNFDLVVVGPEKPLADGFVDLCNEHGLAAFGPNRISAQLESSKSFSKKVLQEAQIPTAAFVVAHSAMDCAAEAKKMLTATGGVVLKASGLAQGKGVFVCKTQKDIDDGLARLYSPSMREASTEVVLETITVGRECSFFILCGPGGVLELDFAVDHKRLLNDDQGPNTGGMGAYAPASWLPADARDQVMAQIIDPLMKTLKKRGEPYSGWLYVGIMWTAKGPSVIEFNVRLGDPEAQILAVHDSRDWVSLIRQALGLEPLDSKALRTSSGVCTVGVVMASQGYPYGEKEGGFGTVKKSELQGEHWQCFAAAIKPQDEAHVSTASGRVFTIVARGTSWAEAKKRAYEGVTKIKSRVPSLQFRTDIAAMADRNNV